MKQFINTAKNWIILGLFASFTIIVSLVIFLKARQTTDPNIADDGQWFYANPGNTLTAGKWNSVVSNSKVNYKKLSLTDWDYQTTSSFTAVPWADLTMTTLANPVLISVSLPVINNGASAAAIYCDIAIDWTKLSSWWRSFRSSLTVWFAETLNFNYITSTLSAWSHNFKIYCLSDWWRILMKKNSALPSQFNVMELKQ